MFNVIVFHFPVDIFSWMICIVFASYVLTTNFLVCIKDMIFFQQVWKAQINWHYIVALFSFHKWFNDPIYLILHKYQLYNDELLSRLLFCCLTYIINTFWNQWKCDKCLLCCKVTRKRRLTSLAKNNERTYWVYQTSDFTFTRDRSAYSAVIYVYAPLHLCVCMWCAIL